MWHMISFECEFYSPVNIVQVMLIHTFVFCFFWGVGGGGGVGGVGGAGAGLVL